MKKLFFLAAAVLSVALFTGCDGSGSGGGGITVNPGTLNFTAEGGTDFVTVTGSDWTVTSNNPGWVTAVKQGNSVAVTVVAATEARTGSVTVASSSDSKVINIVQAAPAGGGDTPVFEIPEDAAGMSAAFDTFTLIDKDGDGYNWGFVEFTDGTNPTGEFGIASNSWYSSTGPLFPNNYFILPAQTINTNGKVVIKVTASDAAYYNEKFKIVVSSQPITFDNCESAEVILTETLTIGGFDNISTYTANIPSSYNGGTVYVGVAHFDSTDVFNITVTGISVTHNGPAPAPALYAPADVKSIPAYMQQITRTGN